MKTYSAIVALLASVFLLIAGSAVASLIVPLRAKIEGFPELAIGLRSEERRVGKECRP